MLFTKFLALALPALALAAPAPQQDADALQKEAEAKSNSLQDFYSKFQMKEDGTLVGPGGWIDSEGKIHQGEYTGGANEKRTLGLLGLFKGKGGGGGCGGGNCGGGGGLTVGIPGLLTTTFGGPGGGITTTVLGQGAGGQVAGSSNGNGGGGGDYIYGQTQQGQPWLWGPNGPQAGQPCATGLCPCSSCPPIFN